MHVNTIRLKRAITKYYSKALLNRNKSDGYREFSGANCRTRVNGALYIANSKYLRQHRSFIGDGTQPLVIDDGKESLDIDTEWDWKLAEYLSGIG